MIDTPTEAVKATGIKTVPGLDPIGNRSRCHTTAVAEMAIMCVR
ncbi:MAG: hypothetical protein ACRYFY_17935 [Janthinobacterium lividum]